MMPYNYMFFHSEIGTTSFQRSKMLFHLLRNSEISLAGNAALKIYGTLNCKSGVRLKPENRVFFRDEAEALSVNYRPCGHCMREAYTEWKQLAKGSPDVKNHIGLPIRKLRKKGFEFISLRLDVPVL